MITQYGVYIRMALISRGPDGSFDKDMIYPASEIITHDDTHWIYYNGYPERHGIGDRGKYGIGLATLKLDRFIGRRASGQQTGSLVTRPFKLAGTKLQLNVSATAGRIRVEVLDAQRNPLPGFSGSDAPWQTAVDSLRWQPQWKTDLAPLRGKLIRLRFQLENASLYAFQIK